MSSVSSSDASSTDTGENHLQTEGPRAETGPFPSKILSQVWSACINPPRDLFPLEKHAATKKKGHWCLAGKTAEKAASDYDEVLLLTEISTGSPEDHSISRALLVGQGRLHVMQRGGNPEGKATPWIEIDHSPQSALRRMDGFAKSVQCNGTGRLAKLKKKLSAVL